MTEQALVVKTGPRDVFLHLLAIIALYSVVVGFGAIAFSLIDIYVPDALSEPAIYLRDNLRFPLAAVVIIFPLYILLSYYLSRDVERNPEKRNLRTRRWLIAFTLFLASIVIVGDLVAVLYRFLDGELTLRFLLKVFTVLLIAGAVAAYYAWAFRKNKPALSDPLMRIFVIVVSAIVLAAVVAGFMAAGSPAERRARRFDEERVGHLQSIQYEITSFWQVKERLPKSLDELRDDLRGYVPSVDPETGAAYEYNATGKLSFELCATFARNAEVTSPKATSAPYPEFGDTWAHGAGRTCFTRTIDPERFPPLKIRQ